MKCIKYLFILIMLGSFASKAQHVGKIDKFEVLPEYLENKKIKLSTGATTTIKYKVTFARENATTTPKVTWKPFNMTIRLSTPSQNGNIILLGSSYNIKSEDFPSGVAFLKDKIFTAILDNSKLNIANPVILAYTINNTDQPVYSYSQQIYYPAQSSTGTPGTPVNTDSVAVYSIYNWYTGGTMYSRNPQVEPGKGQKNRGIAFYVPSGNELGTQKYNELYMDYGSGFPRYDYRYERGLLGSGWFNTGFSFDTYSSLSKARLVPVYRYSNSEGRGIFYSTRVYTQRYISYGIAFYAYPVPDGGGGADRNSGREERPADESIGNGRYDLEPEMWTLSGDGTFYYLKLETLFSNLNSFNPEINYAEIFAFGRGDFKMPFVKDGYAYDFNDYQGGISLIVRSVNTVIPAPLPPSFRVSYRIYNR